MKLKRKCWNCKFSNECEKYKKMGYCKNHKFWTHIKL